MDQRQEIQRINSGGANFANFSATANFEPAPHSTPQAYLLVLFGNFVPSAAELADAITGFTESKEPDAVMEFVYWVNDVLENFSSTFTGRSNMQPS
ncbi:hypothetical protein PHPALM_28717 [Phytophthora palmivora]|uniref:Uncharacterized protein n=1 Tax=Phytophthora palmivora TaxID=4796 RepID=A0A2P4X9C8_9STRA|nr:hypothetical protein PHPALM_28717 [Phytophthora palmivora]